MRRQAVERYAIPPEKQARMLALLAMAWDGQWFLKVYDEYGMRTLRYCCQPPRSRWS
jgi:hypothetical protein